MLNLTINEQKSDLFNDGQTPTPTGLLKNCEAVGLFDDLCHVNPFDETFRRACEQTAVTGHTPRQVKNATTTENEQDVLHTPQVYPNEDACKLRIVECLPNSPPSAPVVTLDVPVVEDLWTNASTNTNNENASETITTLLNHEQTEEIIENITPSNQNTINHSIVQWTPQTVQLVQPQVFAINLPAASIANKNIPAAAKQPGKAYILPKLSTNINKTDTLSNVNNQTALTNATDSTTKSFLEQSSASLTPPSQLPIKERLKALCNNNIKCNANKEFISKCSLNDTNDAIERKRAAAKRYRHKIRNKQEDLLQQNKRLQVENERLLAENKQLKQQLAKALSTSERTPAQIQIPPSTIHFVMNIPNVTLPVNNLLNVQQKTQTPLTP